MKNFTRLTFTEALQKDVDALLGATYGDLLTEIDHARRKMDWVRVASASKLLSELETGDYCPLCESGSPVPHSGSRRCESGSLASGGKNAHCTCDTPF